jgi:hypothetical protein
MFQGFLKQQSFGSWRWISSNEIKLAMGIANQQNPIHFQQNSIELIRC